MIDVAGGGGGVRLLLLLELSRQHVACFTQNTEQSDRKSQRND